MEFTSLTETSLTEPYRNLFLLRSFILLRAEGVFWNIIIFSKSFSCTSLSLCLTFLFFFFYLLFSFIFIYSSAILHFGRHCVTAFKQIVILQNLNFVKQYHTLYSFVCFRLSPNLIATISANSSSNHQHYVLLSFKINITKKEDKYFVFCDINLILNPRDEKTNISLFYD